jgi:redox-sensitive bicupin YhaK (pirin superfamily)
VATRLAPVPVCGLVLFDGGDEITVRAGEEGIRFLLVSGKPIEEPVTWYGPIVMNTEEELERAVRDLREGTFIRESRPADRPLRSPRRQWS